MKLHFLSGLPRTGSTLLTAILYQNPLIHTEGVSGLCDLLWSSQESVTRNKLWNGNKRDSSSTLKAIPELYYQDVSRPIVIDKCRAWSLPLNIKMIQDWIDPDFKMICMTRDLTAIEHSFQKLFRENHRDDYRGSPFESELKMAEYGISHIRSLKDQRNFLFVDYENLVSDSELELHRIYEFLELPVFKHDFSNIENLHKEDDSLYGLTGMHDVRKTVGKRNEIR